MELKQLNVNVFSNKAIYFQVKESPPISFRFPPLHQPPMIFLSDPMEPQIKSKSPHAFGKLWVGLKPLIGGRKYHVSFSLVEVGVEVTSVLKPQGNSENLEVTQSND